MHATDNKSDNDKSVMDGDLLAAIDVDPYLNHICKLTDSSNSCDKHNLCTGICDTVNISHTNFYSNDHQPRANSSHTSNTTKQDTRVQNYSAIADNSAQLDPYPYTAHVLTLQSCKPSIGHRVRLPAAAERIITPLKLNNWKWAMNGYPDTHFADYIANGIEQGFCIGFGYGSVQCTSSKSNAKSASRHPEPITAYLHKELNEGRIAGPLLTSTAPACSMQ